MILLARNILFNPDRNRNLEILSTGINFVKSVNRPVTCSFLFVFQRKNTKRVPSFRKLLRTSQIKLDNKLKNKQYKQKSAARKYRKEQKKLREAVRDAISRKPFPLEDHKKKQVGKCLLRYEYPAASCCKSWEKTTSFSVYKQLLFLLKEWEACGKYKIWHLELSVKDGRNVFALIIIGWHSKGEVFCIKVSELQVEVRHKMVSKVWAGFGFQG